MPLTRREARGRRRAGRGGAPWRAALVVAVVLLTCALPAGAVSWTVLTAEAGTRWRADYPAAMYGNAVLAGQDVVVVTSALLAVVDAGSGEERWRRPLRDTEPVDWLVPAGRLVLATSHAAPTGESGDLRAASLADGGELWRRDGLTRAGVWRGPYAGEAAGVVPAWSPDKGRLEGVDPATGSTRWTWRPPPSCATPSQSASDGGVVVVVAGCRTTVAVFALDPADGRSRWRADFASVRDLRLLPGTVAVADGDGFTLLRAATGRATGRVASCMPGCIPPRAAGEAILLSYPAGDVQALRAARELGAAQGSPVLGVLSDGDALGRTVDLIDPARAVIGRQVLPVAYRPFGMRRATLFTAERVTGPGRAPRLALAAVDLVPGRLPVTAPRPDPCDLLAPRPGVRAEPSGRAPHLLCDFTDAAGMRFTLGVWSASSADGAAALWRETRDTLDGHPVPDLGDEAFASGPRDGAIVVRRARHIVWVRSPYLPLRDRLPRVAKEAVARLGRVPQAVRPLAVPEPGPVSHESDPPPVTSPGMPPPVVLPGTAVTVRPMAGDPISVIGYRQGRTTRLRDRSGRFTIRLAGPATVSSDGRWAVSVAGGRRLDIVDRSSGRKRRVDALPKLYGPSWSDSDRLILTRRDEARFVIVDPLSGRVRPVWIDSQRDAVQDSSFHWNADARTVSASFTSFEGGLIHHLLRSFDLTGRRTSELSHVGDTADGTGDRLSPGRSRFLAGCADRPQDFCVHQAGTGRLLAHLEIDGRPVAWYDDEHLVVWRRGAPGSQAAVVDLYGTPTRILAEAANHDDTLELIWTRSPSTRGGAFR
ncbi:outer membrane protein assembly factor BamB family protein [Sphaerisporangium sp. NPDC004334]